FVAKVLPDGATSFVRYTRNPLGLPTDGISTYTRLDGTVGARTNTFVYAGNDLDLLRRIGPQGEQVSSNWFNAYHQVLTNFNALDEKTIYTYNANRQLTSVLTPAGLTTTNIYFTAGASVNRLDKTIDLEINRTNAYTYYSNGLVNTHTDERDLTTTSYWDNL